MQRFIRFLALLLVLPVLILGEAALGAGYVLSSGPVWGADGSVSAPQYTFANDDNTGMYRIGSDNIGIGLGGINIFDIGLTDVAIKATLTAGPTSGTDVTEHRLLGYTSGATLDIRNRAAGNSSLVFTNAAGTSLATIVAGLGGTSELRAGAESTAALMWTTALVSTLKPFTVYGDGSNSGLSVSAGNIVNIGNTTGTPSTSGVATTMYAHSRPIIGTSTPYTASTTHFAGELSFSVTGGTYGGLARWALGLSTGSLYAQAGDLCFFNDTYGECVASVKPAGNWLIGSFASGFNQAHYVYGNALELRNPFSTNDTAELRFRTGQNDNYSVLKETSVSGAAVFTIAPGAVVTARHYESGGIVRYDRYVGFGEAVDDGDVTPVFAIKQLTDNFPASGTLCTDVPHHITDKDGIINVVGRWQSSGSSRSNFGPNFSGSSRAYINSWNDTNINVCKASVTELYDSTQFILYVTYVYD